MQKLMPKNTCLLTFEEMQQLEAKALNIEEKFFLQKPPRRF
ncbi:hypothetical protein G5S_0851 [Chlamydia pecorum E58]|uniref:Uncharacterized protein n=1 Tax=Chlamydia pecorum (strain ATCC VR-628 / DSM 29919 / E58) TaxID=331635 RepID=A0AA34RDP6_CHLPE|nr:hypothetical protein G5S_0851 [Chlamydia pecorum E58]